VPSSLVAPRGSRRDGAGLVVARSRAVRAAKARCAWSRWRSRASQGPLSSDGRMNHRMAAPTKNNAPTITLSRTLTGKAGNSQPTNAPGQSQQAAPATAKATARILIAIAAPAHSHPTVRRARGNKVRSCCLARCRCRVAGIKRAPQPYPSGDVSPISTLLPWQARTCANPLARCTPPRFGLSDLTHGRGPYGAGMIRMSACLDYLTVGAPSAMVSAVL
jgi:hypothetical protein